MCRELTKTHEEVRRGTLGELAEWASDGLLGEITVVVGGAPEQTAEAPEPGVLAAEVANREQTGLTRKEAIAVIAASRGLPKRVVYEAVVAAKG